MALIYIFHGFELAIARSYHGGSTIDRVPSLERRHWSAVNGVPLTGCRSSEACQRGIFYYL